MMGPYLVRSVLKFSMTDILIPEPKAHTPQYLMPELVQGFYKMFVSRLENDSSFS